MLESWFLEFLEALEGVLRHVSQESEAVASSWPLLVGAGTSWSDAGPAAPEPSTSL